MLRSLYAYKGTHARTLGFQAGEKFLEISQSRDPNWLHVISERGALGYVPKNYVALEECQPCDMLEFIDGSIEATHLNASERGGSYSKSEHEALHKLVEIRQEWYSKAPPSSLHPSKRPAPPPPQRTSSQLSGDSVDGGRSCGQASPSGGSSPRPPSITSLSSLTASSSNLSLGAPPVREPTPVQDESSGSSEGHDTSIGYESELRSDVDSNVQTNLKSLVSQVPPDYLRTLVENVRSQTSVSYTTSHQVVEIVLKSLSGTLSSLQPLCSHILQGKTNEVSQEHNSVNNSTSWKQSSDGRTLVELLERLREHKDDDQQRSWALHEDEYTIATHLNALLDLLNNGDLVACRSVLQLDDFRPLLTLVQYYQMETRWPLRKLLLQVFGAVCQMAAANISYLSASVLPVEFTRQLIDGSNNEEFLQYTALVLGMVLCMGDTLPYTHFSVMNSKFIEVLLCGIEEYCEDPDKEQLGELYLTLVFAFNLQYTLECVSKEKSGCDSDSENLVIKLLSSRESTKYFTEKLLVLFNREEDPLAMFEHSPRPIHSVLKMMLDVYSNPATSQMIYTNDERVVCDIIVRQLSDLPPDDKHRYLYLCLLEGVMMQGSWQEHQHRKTELLRCCNNILAEDEENTSKKDKDIINRIYQKCPLILG